MNLAELETKLIQSGVPTNVFSLNGDWTKLAYDGYLLVHKDGTWIVQYFERGATRDLARFESESSACEYLFDKLTAPEMLRQLGCRKPR